MPKPPEGRRDWDGNAKRRGRAGGQAVGRVVGWVGALPLKGTGPSVCRQCAHVWPPMLARHRHQRLLTKDREAGRRLQRRERREELPHQRGRGVLCGWVVGL